MNPELFELSVGNIFNWIIFFGLLYVLFDSASSHHRAEKAKKRLTQIEKLVQQASKTDDEEEKAKILKKIFEILEAKL